MKKVFKKYSYLLFGIFVFLLFAYITYKTPLAGDDWGYALNGTAGKPIRTAIDFYYSWSGRFFSELWGMLIPCRKWLWNIINPLLFLGIYLCIYKICNVKHNSILCTLLIIAMIISVDDNLRMETYTWIMGTTYVIPLLFSLIYFLTISRIVFDNNKKINKLVLLLNNILLFVIGLMMENIAASMIFGIIILIIYSYKNNKKIVKYLLINLFFSSVSFIIMRLSPGSSYRLISEHSMWANSTIFEKLILSYPNFLQITFINNNYAIGLFSIGLILLLLFNKEIKLTLKIIFIVVLFVGIISDFSFVFGNNFATNPNSIFSMLFWPIYIISSFMVLYLCIKDNKTKLKSIFCLLIGGSSALVMMFSPIYGSRSAIYLVFYMICSITIVYDSLDFDKNIYYFVLLIILLAIVCDRTIEYFSKYKLVGKRETERQEIIKYYQNHPEDDEAWIPRFPIFTIHGADVEPDDIYHLETFKEYYKLPQDANKIIFYFVEDK